MWLKNKKRGREHVWLFALLFLTAHVNADVGFFESEPNNEPQDFEPISGAITVYGVLDSNDQDGYLWTLHARSTPIMETSSNTTTSDVC